MSINRKLCPLCSCTPAPPPPPLALDTKSSWKDNNFLCFLELLNVLIRKVDEIFGFLWPVVAAVGIPSIIIIYASPGAALPEFPKDNEYKTNSNDKKMKDITIMEHNTNTTIGHYYYYYY